MKTLLICTCLFAAMVASVAQAAETYKVDFPLDLVINQQCFDSLYGELNYKDVECLKMVLSKLAGYGIVGGAGLLKVPIIINILRNKSATGLSSSSLYLETSLYICNLVYCYFQQLPISTYGEVFPLLAQNMVLVLMLWSFRSTSFLERILVGAVLAGITAGAWNLPEEYWYLLMTWAMVGSLVSRVPQIIENWRNGHTGVQSIVTSLLQVAGAFVRLLTVLQEVSDPLVAGVSVLATTLHAIVFLQIVVYWKATGAMFKKQKKE